MRRALVNLSVIVCGIALFWISAKLGFALATRGMNEPDRAYYAIPVTFGSPFALAALACSTYFLWGKRDVRLFFASAVLIGLATTLWPLTLGLIY
jgi:hypothetical protein